MHFQLTDAMLDDIRQATADGGKYLLLAVTIVNDQGETVAINKTLYIRKKSRH